MIVIDFYGLANSIGLDNERDKVCGGRHQLAIKKWTQLLDALKATGSKLVFFSDLNIQEGKVDVWLNRRNEDFKTNVKLYDLISEGRTLSEIAAKQDTWKSLTSIFYNLAEIAHSYGEFNFSIQHECDLELAQYATVHKAMAVITNDTDFLIFEGKWKLWFSHSIYLTDSNQLRIVDYNKYALANIFGLAPDQLPMFATLMGNDFTSSHYDELTNFCKTMGPLKYRFQNIAHFVRKEWYGHSKNNNIDRIVHRVFGYVNDDRLKLIKDSLDSYNINFPPANISNPIEAKLLHTTMYRLYMGNMGQIHGIILHYYDFRGCPAGANLTSLLTDWVKRRKGVVGIKGTFTLLTQRNINEPYMTHMETVTCPDCKFTHTNFKWIQFELQLIFNNFFFSFDSTFGSAVS